MFLSVRCVNDREQAPTLQDDLESAFWVLLWIALAYFDSSLCRWELHRFMQATLGRKSNVADFVQKSAVVDGLSVRDLFPDYPSLRRLLLDLARLFRDHSDTSSTGEHTLARGRLQNHDDVIGRFKHYLEQENWSTGKRHVCTHCDRFHVWDRWTLL